MKIISKDDISTLIYKRIRMITRNSMEIKEYDNKENIEGYLNSVEKLVGEIKQLMNEE